MASVKYPKIGRRVLRFPFGYRVEIREVKQSDLNRHVEDIDGIWIPRDGGGIILISRSQSYDSKLDVLHHEMAHALADYDSWLQANYAEPFRAQQALQLAQDVAEADED